MKKIIFLVFALLLIAPLCCFAQDDTPLDAGWRDIFSTGPLVDDHFDLVPGGTAPQNYGTYCGPFTVTSQTNQLIISEAVTPEITSLAANLQNDPLRIFNYVHDRIRYVHYFGSKKGAYLTLLEGSGNDFDQCALFTALIRAAATNAGANYSVHYQFGLMTMPYSAADNFDLQHWFGFSVPPASQGTSSNTLCQLIREFNGGRNYPTYTLNGSAIANNDGTTNNFSFHRVWVRLTYGGTDYYLDPAFKVSTFTPGIDVLAAMGFNSSTFFSQAGSGATISNDFVQHLNWANLSSQLQSYTTSFLSYLTNHPNLSVPEVIGGYSIKPAASQTLPCLPFSPITSFTSTDQVSQNVPIFEWDNIPTNYMTRLTVKVDNINLSLPFPSLQARKLSMTFTNLSGNYQPQICLDDVVQQTGSVSMVGSNDIPTMTNTIIHPRGAWDYTNNIVVHDSSADQHDNGADSITYKRTAHGYTFVYGFDDVGQLLKKREEKLNTLLRQNFSSSSPEIVTETLNVMGLGWLNQCYLSDSVLASQKDIMVYYHHRMGRVASEAGYFVDMRLLLNTFYWRDGTSISSQYSNTNDPSLNVLRYASFCESALEHGVIEQVQGIASTSTTKCLYQANQSGQKIILSRYASGGGTTIRRP